MHAALGWTPGPGSIQEDKTRHPGKVPSSWGSDPWRSGVRAGGGVWDPLYSPAPPSGSAFAAADPGAPAPGLSLPVRPSRAQTAWTPPPGRHGGRRARGSGRRPKAPGGCSRYTGETEAGGRGRGPEATARARSGPAPTPSSSPRLRSPEPPGKPAGPAALQPPIPVWPEAGSEVTVSGPEVRPPPAPIGSMR